MINIFHSSFKSGELLWYVQAPVLQRYLSPDPGFYKIQTIYYEFQTIVRKLSLQTTGYPQMLQTACQ